MRIEGDTVCFKETDMHFVKQFGLDVATEMVLDYDTYNNTPFIYDIIQLASFLHLKTKWIHDVLNNIPKHYRRYQIPKKSGGIRYLDEPIGRLRTAQRRINDEILCWLRPSPYATAYHFDAHLADNASPHVGKRFLLKMDITDFFGSIRFDMVLSSAFNTSRYPTHIGTMLTSFCCLDDVLPQGACTSPALSNLVMKNFDDTFGEWCRLHNFSYTRYSDDITVSGNKSLYPAYRFAKDMLNKMGFEINERKTHFITNASRQIVTGLTVNTKVNINSDYKRKLRQELYYAIKYGIPDVVLRQQMKDYIESNTPETGYVRYYKNLMGRINYVLSIEPNNTYFIKAKERLHEKRFDLK